MKKVRGLFPLFDLVLGTKKGERVAEMAGGERENRKQRGAVANYIL